MWELEMFGGPANWCLYTMSPASWVYRRAPDFRKLQGNDTVDGKNPAWPKI